MKGAYKRLVTQTEIAIELKGKESYMIPDCSNPIICSNEDYFTPAEKKERRHQILRLDDELAGRQNAKTRPIIMSVVNTDIMSVAKFFYERDISDFNPEWIIATDALREQKIEAMDELDQRLLQILNRGMVNSNGFDKVVSEGQFNKVDFYTNVGEPIKHMNETKFWKKIQKMFPGIKDGPRETVGKSRFRTVIFPTLEQMRDGFRKQYDDDKWPFEEPEQMDDDENEDDA
jgi:hypothetical protein